MIVAERLASVRARIAERCERSGRAPDEVQLVAVSKGHAVEKIVEAYEQGQRVFGENYAQALAEKAAALSHLEGLEWRFIGHLQRNKVKLILGARATVDALDSERLANAIAKGAASSGVRVPVLIQVNIAGEVQKSGCRPDALPRLVEHVRSLSELTLRGLMTVPPHTEDPEGARVHFSALRELAVAHDLTCLSMGMTHDLEVAIEEGATEVRIGTAIFGPRPVIVR